MHIKRVFFQIVSHGDRSNRITSVTLLSYFQSFSCAFFLVQYISRSLIIQSPSLFLEQISSFSNNKIVLSRTCNEG